MNFRVRGALVGPCFPSLVAGVTATTPRVATGRHSFSWGGGQQNRQGHPRAPRGRQGCGGAAEPPRARKDAKGAPRTEKRRLSSSSPLSLRPFVVFGGRPRQASMGPARTGRPGRGEEGRKWAWPRVNGRAGGAAGGAVRRACWRRSGWRAGRGPCRARGPACGPFRGARAWALWPRCRSAGRQAGDAPAKGGSGKPARLSGGCRRRRLPGCPRRPRPCCGRTR